MQHHEGSQEEFAAQKRLIEEIFEVAEPRFPGGKLNERDEGELSFAIAADLRKKVVIIRWAKPIDWCGLDSKSARHMANLLNEKADQIDGIPLKS